LIGKEAKKKVRSSTTSITIQKVTSLVGCGLRNLLELEI
jgi:hypothetical protein